MSDWQSFELAQGRIHFSLPPEWGWFPDGLGGGAIPPGRDAVMHVRAEVVEDPGRLPNLSRMLAGFLTEHVRPIATDELHSFAVEGGQGFAWHYLEEWDDPPRVQSVRLWVMGNERAWAFVNFQGEREALREQLAVGENIVATFKFLG